MNPEHDNLTNALCKSPLVSVVICVYNAGEYLRPSLLSILEQTYRNLDIVIVDDGSTDGCFDLVQDLLADTRIRLFRQRNATKPVAFNRALDQLRGEFYAIHDADDISYPTRIERQVHTLLNRPHLAAVFCGNELIINDRSIAPLFATKSEDDCKRDVDAFRMPALDPTGMFRRSLIGHIRFDPSLPIAETYDYILKVGEQHPMMVLGECLYGYRILSSSLTRRDPAYRQQLVAQALRRACERRGLEYDREFPIGLHYTRRSQNSIRDNNIAAHFMQSALDQRRANRTIAALRTALHCIRLQPLDGHYYKALVYALISPNFASFIRRKHGEQRSYNMIN